MTNLTGKRSKSHKSTLIGIRQKSQTEANQCFLMNGFSQTGVIFRPDSNAENVPRCRCREFLFGGGIIDNRLTHWAGEWEARRSLRRNQLGHLMHFFQPAGSDFLCLVDRRFVAVFGGIFFRNVPPVSHGQKKGLAISRKALILLVATPGIEPGTSGLWIPRSNRLSYVAEMIW